jgi:hypothetical protein
MHVFNTEDGGDVPSKRQLNFNGLHGTTSHATGLFSHEVGWSSFELIFGKYVVRTTTILTEVFRGFLSLLGQMLGYELEYVPASSFHILSFVVRFSPVILASDAA